MAEDTKAKNILGGAIGIPLTLATQIPNLVRGGRERDQLRKMQAGAGAGAVQARASKAQASRDALSLAGAGRGPNSGLTLRSAIRNVGSAGDSGAAEVAARESMAATQSLRSNDIARRAAIGQVGAATGGALAQFQAQQLAAGDQTGKQELAGVAEQEKALANMQAGVIADPAAAVAEKGVDPTPVAQAQGFQPAPGASTAEAGQAGLDYLQAARQKYQPSGNEQARQAVDTAKQQVQDGIKLPDLDPVALEYEQAQTEYTSALRSPRMTWAIASGIPFTQALDLHFPGLSQRRAAALAAVQAGGLA